MPLYEYRCGSCDQHFEVFQSIHAVAEETACPQCHAKKATRLLSAFASKIVGDHKPGHSEMKAYGMLNERMNKFGKLPPLFGKRSDPKPNMTSPSDSSSTGDGS